MDVNMNDIDELNRYLDAAEQQATNQGLPRPTKGMLIEAVLCWNSGKVSSLQKALAEAGAENARLKKTIEAETRQIHVLTSSLTEIRGDLRDAMERVACLTGEIREFRQRDEERSKMKLTAGDPCPCCVTPLVYDAGSPETREEPGIAPILFCPECGADYTNIDWDRMPIETRITQTSIGTGCPTKGGE